MTEERKKILYLTYFYEPDLSAGSFRNTAFANALSKSISDDSEISLFTTLPNRYHTYSIEAPQFEKKNNISIIRIIIPPHKNKLIDQAKAYRKYYKSVLHATANNQYDIVFVSSGRFFTSYLGYKIAKKKNIPLYLDVRDIFSDTMKHVFEKKWYMKPLVQFLEYLERKPYRYASHINLVSEGFKDYFLKYPGSYSYFTNGIDDEFISPLKNNFNNSPSHYIITYAGNIGEGQGLEKIIPEAAKKLGNGFYFKIIGDGGTRKILEAKIREMQLQNVELILPISRKDLLKIYSESHFLFLHLNDYDAFRKVLPSKIFEYGAYPLPLIAGVSGYAAEFIQNYVSNTLLFEPGNVEQMIALLKSYQYKQQERNDFIKKFRRENIVEEMAENMLLYLK